MGAGKHKPRGGPAARVRRAGAPGLFPYNDAMLKLPRRTGVAGPGLCLAFLLSATFTPLLLAEGLAPLQRIVDEACACAAQYATGMDAAVRCTDGPRRFGRLKVGARAGWNEAQRSAAADLEAIIETCIANAEDATRARDRLGVTPVNGDGTPVLAYWKRVAPAELEGHVTKLVRISRKGTGPIKGLVLSGDGTGVVLSLARRDGGGNERVAYDAIEDAWVMELPTR